MKIAVAAAVNIKRGMNLFYADKFKRGTNIVFERNAHVYIYCAELPTHEDLI